MNRSTILGALVGLAVLGYAIFSQTGNVALFWNPEGIAIVLGGVVAATFICYPLGEVQRALKAVGGVFRAEDLPLVHAIEAMRDLAEQAMASGSYRLDAEVEVVENHFLKDGLRMVVDNLAPERMRKVMETTILEVRRAGMAEAAIFRSMARLAPAFGMVGTLIGLIVMFQNMSGGMEKLGPAMAVALTTTFYGVVLANLVFVPVATKLERRVAQRVTLMRVIMEGSLLLARKTPPELMVDELKAFLPQRSWQDLTSARAPASELAQHE